MKEMLVIKKQIQLPALRVALVAVRLPLRFTSGCTWHLESWRSRLQTAINTISPG